MSVTSTKQKIETLKGWIQFMKRGKVDKSKSKKRKNRQYLQIKNKYKINFFSKKTWIWLK